MQQWYEIMRKFMEIEVELNALRKVNDDLLSIYMQSDKQELYSILYLYQKYMSYMGIELGEALEDFDLCIVNNEPT